MTGQALGIIEARVVLQLAVRIVTSPATNPWITFFVAAAVKDPIRLKPNVVEPSLSRHEHHLIEAPMARATKFLREVIRIHSARIEDPQILRTRGDRRNVFFSRAMTALAGDAGDQSLKLQLRTVDRAWGMTAETFPCLTQTQRPAHRLGG